MISLMKIIFLFSLTCLISSTVYSQESAEEPPMEIVKYYFVELITNEERADIPQNEVDSIQNAHMANIGDMIKNKKLVLAGPFEDGGGIFILQVNSIEEAEKLCQADPAVSAGRLKTKIRPWYTTKGVFTLEQ